MVASLKKFEENFQKDFKKLTLSEFICKNNWIKIPCTGYFRMTEIQQYFDLMKDVEENFITYIGENSQNNNFLNYLDKQKIIEN